MGQRSHAIPRKCHRCGGPLERGRRMTCEKCAMGPPPVEEVPPLTEVVWITAELLPVYERVCAIYSPQRVSKWMREVYEDPAHRDFATKIKAMTLTITSADEVAPWWQEATDQLGPEAPWEKVWPLANYLLLEDQHGPEYAKTVMASYGLPSVPPDAPRASGRTWEGSPAPAGIPPSFYDLRDPPGKGLASITPLGDDPLPPAG